MKVHCATFRTTNTFRSQCCDRGKKQENIVPLFLKREERSLTF